MLLSRDEKADDLAIGYYVAEDITRIANELKVDCPYNDVLYHTKTIDIVNEDRSLKTQLFNMLIRINRIKKDKANPSYFHISTC